MKYNMLPYTEAEETSCKRKMIKVNGQGMVRAEPDIAIINMGIVVKDKNPEAAQAKNSIITQNVINALLQKNISKDDIKTISYSIYPEYDYIEGQQVLSGYNVTHILEVKVRDLDTVGEIIETATQNGVNQINGVEFTIEDSKIYYGRALKLAVRDAEAKAMAIARAMKVTLEQIPCSITELSTSFTPFQEQSTMKLNASAAVIPGKIEIKATIVAEFQYM